MKDTKTKVKRLEQVEKSPHIYSNQLKIIIDTHIQVQIFLHIYYDITEANMCHRARDLEEN